MVFLLLASANIVVESGEDYLCGQHVAAVHRAAREPDPMDCVAGDETTNSTETKTGITDCCSYYMRPKSGTRVND